MDNVQDSVLENNIEQDPSYIVKVGDTNYTSFNQALSEIEGQSDVKVTLLNDVTLTSATTLGFNGILDLAEHTIYVNGQNFFSGAGVDVTIINGTVSNSGNYAIYVRGTLNIEDVIIKGAKYGIYMAYDTGIANIKSGTIYGINVTPSAGNSLVNILGGTVLPGAYPILIGARGTVNIEDGVVSGTTYTIVNNGGTLNINGGFVKASNKTAIQVNNSNCTINISGGCVLGYMYAINGASGKTNINISISGGRITGETDSAINLQQNYHAEITGGIIAGYGNTASGIVAWGNTQLDISAPASVLGDLYGICTNGSVDAYSSNAHITINGGTITGSALGMYLPSYNGVTTILDGHITGETGIEVRAGTLNVLGGTITGIGTELITGSNTSGATTLGAGIVVSQHTSKNILNINIENATVSGAASVAVIAPESNSTLTDGSQINVKSGIYEGEIFVQDNLTTTSGEPVDGFISGGQFNTPFDSKLINENETAVGVNNENWYVGDISNILDNLTEGDILDIINAPNNIDIPEGVTVNNNTGKNIIINGQLLKEGMTSLVTKFIITPASVNNLRVGNTCEFIINLEGMKNIADVIIDTESEQYIKVISINRINNVWTFIVEGLDITEMPAILTVTLSGIILDENYILPAGEAGYVKTIQINVIEAKEQLPVFEEVELVQSINTPFQEMYDFFLAGITDDMFMELTVEDTHQILEEILIAALPHFEFPRWADPFDLDFEKKEFTTKLTAEEKMIIRQYMISEWIGYQLATIDLVRQKYSGSDFKFTSQASHIKQLTTMKKEYETKGFHLQRVYCRRAKDHSGQFRSTFSQIMEPLK